MNENLTETETSTTSSNISILLGIGTATILGLTLMQGTRYSAKHKIQSKATHHGMIGQMF